MNKHTIEIKSLQNIDYDSIYKAFSFAFVDYDFQITHGGLKAMLKRRGYNAALSFAAFDGNDIVSFVLNGIGNFGNMRTAYDTGTGTVKDERGKGLAAAVFEHSIPYLKAAGVKQYLLEVLQHNEKAVSLYKKQGFEIVREFDYYFKKNCEIKLAQNRNANFCVKEITLEKYEQLSSFWDFVPSWQNDFDSVKRARDCFVSLGTFCGDKLIGYCIFEPSTGDVAQLAVDKNYRRQGAATLMFSEMLARNKRDSVAFVNVDTTCNTMSKFLKSKNITSRGKQYEMLKKI